VGVNMLKAMRTVMSCSHWAISIFITIMNIQKTNFRIHFFTCYMNKSPGLQIKWMWYVHFLTLMRVLVSDQCPGWLHPPHW
jgi:hypothetical protein